MRSDESESAFRRGFLAGAAKKSMLATMPGREGQLLEDAQSSDTKRASDALCCLLEYYEPNIVDFLGHKLPKHAVIETWSEIVFRVTRRLHRPPPLSMEQGKPFLSYLYRIAHNAVLDTLVEASNDKVGSLEMLLEQRPDDFSDGSSLIELVESGDDEDMDAFCFDSLPADVRDELKDDPLMSAYATHAHGETSASMFTSANGLGRHGRDPVIWALAKLPPGHRACLILHDWFGLEFAAVGALMDVPEATVCFRAWAGRKRVRADLAYMWWEEDGRSLRQLAKELRLDEKDVPDYIEEGRRLYARERTQQKRGGRNER